jgi:uncharacterized protein HemX
MDGSQLGLVICLTLFIVVGVNAALYVALRRGNEAGQIELFRRAAQRAREPWKQEDEALRELSRRVAGLQRERSETGRQAETAEPGRDEGRDD